MTPAFFHATFKHPSGILGRRIVVTVKGADGENVFAVAVGTTGRVASWMPVHRPGAPGVSFSFERGDGCPGQLKVFWDGFGNREAIEWVFIENVELLP